MLRNPSDIFNFVAKDFDNPTLKHIHNMKKRYLSVALVVALAGSMLFTSCIGSFSLTNRLLGWNKQIGNKFVNELVFFAFLVVPVYEVSALADILVINSIEFWSGNNPMACGKRVIDGQDGRYLVECDGKGYTITSEQDQSVVRLDFDVDTQAWSVDVDGRSYELFSFVDDSHVKMVTPDGGYQVVELSEAGAYAYRATVNGDLWAQR